MCSCAAELDQILHTKSRNLCWSADLCGAMLSANGLTCAIQPKFSCQLTDWPLWSRLSHQSHKQTPTDGRETKFSPQSVTANQRGNTGITSSDNLEIISTLNRCWSENIFGHLEKNILVIVIKNYWHFSWISWRSQRNITKVWWWHVHPGGDIRHWWWGWWN